MIQVNAIGDACPIPVIKTKKAVESLVDEQVLEVLVDNEIAVANILKYAKSVNASAVSQKNDDGIYSIVISVEQSNEEEVAMEDTDDIVVVLASNKMGEGSDELGQMLMKGYVYAITQTDVLPKEILLYNSGVLLTVEGSESAKDLQELEKRGVVINSCGTCLNHFDKKPSVGNVTNMYDIATRLYSAKKIVKP